MVKEVYSADELAELKKSDQKYVSICALTAGVLVAVCVCLCLLANRNNAQIIKFGNIALCTAAGWYVLYLLRNYVLPIRGQIQRFDIWMYAPREQFVGVVVEIGEIMTLQRGMEVYPVTVRADTGNVILYWDVNQDLPEFGEQAIRFQAVRHQIVAYEVAP